MEAARTRIVCTVGPSSSTPTILARMMRAGMDGARLNFSHGTHDEHKTLIRNIRSAARKSGSTIAIIQDLQGPKIRVGVMPEGGLPLHEGQKITFSTAIDEYEHGGAIPVTYRRLHHDVKAGERILLDDGFMETIVTRVSGKAISAKVVVGGVLKSRKGLNLPDSNVSVDPFTLKDHDDLMFGLSQEIDWVVLSFISSPDVALHVRRVVSAAARAHGFRPPKIMAKIETKIAIDHFADILAVVDGIMLGRGDLGLEIPMEEVPIVQKTLVEECRKAHKPIIVATHMLDSMARNPRATRAEISDVANAVLDHTDAVMLSAESASGRYPVATVQAMASVVREAESSRFDVIAEPTSDIDGLTNAMAHTVGVLAQQELIDAIATTTTAGDVAHAMPMYRPHVPIFLACQDEAEARQYMLYAGVCPVVVTQGSADFPQRFHALLVKRGYIRAKHRVAYLSGAGGSLELTIHGV